MLPAQQPQPLPSFNSALCSDHHKSILPNLSYPSRPNAHIPWSGPSAPLLFAVSQTFSLRVLPQPYSFCPQKTTRPEMTIAPGTPNAQVSYPFPSVINLTLTLTFHQFQAPTTANIYFDIYSVSDAFHGFSVLIWVSLTGLLYAFLFWFVFFCLVAQLVNDQSKTQSDQAKALWCQNHEPLRHRQCLNCFMFCALTFLSRYWVSNLIWFSAFLSISFILFEACISTGIIYPFTRLEPAISKLTLINFHVKYCSHSKYHSQNHSIVDQILVYIVWLESQSCVCLDVTGLQN